MGKTITPSTRAATAGRKDGRFVRDVVKMHGVVHVSAELVTDAGFPSVLAELERLATMTPQERREAAEAARRYCTCGDTADGWEECPHAEDEGVAR